MNVTVQNDLIWIISHDDRLVRGRRLKRNFVDECNGLQIIIEAHTDDWEYARWNEKTPLGILLKTINGSDFLDHKMSSAHHNWVHETDVYIVLMPEPSQIFTFSSHDVKVVPF